MANSRQVVMDYVLRIGACERHMPIPLTGRARLAGAQSFCQLLLTMHASWLADALRPPSDRRIHRMPKQQHRI